MTRGKQSGGWSRVCAPTMTANTAVSRWTAPAICSASGGRGACAATSGRRCCLWPRCWKPPSRGRRRGRKYGAAPYAGGPLSQRGGKPTVPKPARPRATAAGAGSVCGKSGRKTGGGVTIRPCKTPVFPGFPHPV